MTLLLFYLSRRFWTNSVICDLVFISHKKPPTKISLENLFSFLFFIFFILFWSYPVKVLNPLSTFSQIYLEQLRLNIKIQILSMKLKFSSIMQINLKDVVHMLHFLKLINFMLLFYFPSSDQSKMVDWL